MRLQSSFRVSGLAAISLLAFVSCGGGGNTGPVVSIKGSDTMLHLVKKWVVSYQQVQPDVSIPVTGGGSGTGIAALLNGTTDICASSRDMTPEEREQAAAKGHEIKEYAVALDGIAIVVNPSNPVADLSLEQLKSIYTGTITNWNQVGGSDAEIVVCSRESSSGTYMFFLEHVLNKENYAPTALLLPATSAVIQSVQESPGAIGYVGLGYADAAGDKIKVIPVRKSADAEPVVPSETTVRSGEYSIARPLYFYTAGEANPALAGFIEFCTGEKGQAIVTEEGYVTVK
ncbi:MAG: phosphate ABC transporter substrate-binding protein [Candidatus Hydrogenedentota bacterium]